MSSPVRYQAVSDIGCVRTNNEDMAYVAGQLVRDASIAAEGSADACVAYAVADGMGGYEGGEVASEIVCRSFAAFMKDSGSDADGQRIKEWAREANRLVCETAALRPELSEMGTTFISLIFNANGTFLLNVGDSRCYRLRRGILKQLSVDHSERERTGNPDVPSNLIYNFMGIPPSEFISDLKTLTTLPGDLYLLCSDGLTDLVDDDFIEANPDPEALVAEAKRISGRDNITIVAIEI